MSVTPKPTADCAVVRFPSGTAESDQVAVEEPLEIRVDGEPLAVTMRTPGHDAELAAGFCLTEGVIDDPDDLERAEPCTLAGYGNVVLVSLAGAAREARREQIARARRDLYMSSSCGLCGTLTIDRLAKQVDPLPTGFTIPGDTLGRLPGLMAEAQEVFSHTGGLHAAALFTPDGQLRLLREDVGRHNAVDKLVGGLLLSGQLPCGPGVLLVSGRASFELVQKAARAGIGFLAAVGAPSSMAVDAAERFGMTLVGFLRADRFNAYAHPDRIGRGPGGG
ncbi:MAG: Protein FdhD-like protein [Gemmataceae bacterium]|nr:Protein FdhD-like protein [Gemmataceae bacterium]